MSYKDDSLYSLAIQRLENIPLLAQFCTRVDELMADDPETFWRCQLLFEELLHSKILTGLVNYELARLLDQPLYLVKNASERNMLLVDGEKFRLEVAILQEPKSRDPYDKQMLYSLSAHQLLGVVGPYELEFEEYYQPSPSPPEVLDRSKRLLSRGRRIVQPGELARFRALENSVSIHLSASPTVVLLFSSRTVSSVCWEYDSRTLLPTRVVANPSSSRLEVAATVLAELEEAEAIPTLNSLFEHPDHFVRWAVVRTLIQLDYDKGLALLQKALKDPHPHVRNAAHRSLAMLGIATVEAQTNHV